DQRHLAETISRMSMLQVILASLPGLEYRHLPSFQDKHGIRSIALMKEELTLEHRHNRRKFQEELQNVFANAAEDRHSLQQCDLCISHHQPWVLFSQRLWLNIRTPTQAPYRPSLRKSQKARLHLQ